MCPILYNNILCCPSCARSRTAFCNAHASATGSEPSDVMRGSSNMGLSSASAHGSAVVVSGSCASVVSTSRSAVVWGSADVIGSAVEASSASNNTITSSTSSCCRPSPAGAESSSTSVSGDVITSELLTGHVVLHATNGTCAVAADAAMTSHSMVLPLLSLPCMLCTLKRTWNISGASRSARRPCARRTVMQSGRDTRVSCWEADAPRARKRTWDPTAGGGNKPGAVTYGGAAVRMPLLPESVQFVTCFENRTLSRRGL